MFSGDGSLQGLNNNIVQHIDIMPTILKMLNYQYPYFAFGKSMFEESWAINFIQNEYRLITESSIIINKEELYNAFSDWNTSEENILDFNNMQLLKAIKQEYNNRMLNNKIIR